MPGDRIGGGRKRRRRRGVEREVFRSIGEQEDEEEEEEKTKLFAEAVIANEAGPSKRHGKRFY